jgi:hypothetical protein
VSSESKSKNVDSGTFPPQNYFETHSATRTSFEKCFQRSLINVVEQTVKLLCPLLQESKKMVTLTLTYYNFPSTRASNTIFFLISLGEQFFSTTHVCSSSMY